MSFHEYFFLEYAGNISANLIATLLGAGLGFYISLKIIALQKEKDRKTRKTRLVIDIKNELMEIQKELTKPEQYYENYKKLAYDEVEEVINGTWFSIEFVGYKQLMQSGYTELFSYNTVQKIALVQLDFQGYAKFEELRLKFNTEYLSDKIRRANLGKSLVDNLDRKQIQVLTTISNALKELEKED